MKASQTIVMVLALAAGLLLGGCGNQDVESATVDQEMVRPAKIVPVISAMVSARRQYPGTLEASQQAELAFRVEGQLIELPAQPGVAVKKGDLLARLDDAVYRNTFQDRQARHELAEIQNDQAGKLVEKQLASQLQYDQAQAELKSAKAALDQASDNLQYTRLLAPFDGIVARVMIDNHQTVQAKTPVVFLQDDVSLDIHFSVPESLITQLKRIDNPAVLETFCGQVRFATLPAKTFSACHKEHESTPDPLTRNYSVVFTLEQVRDYALLPGMTANIQLDFSDFMSPGHVSGMLLPLEAVFEKDDTKWVWLVDEQLRAHQAQVETGRFEGDMLEITQGVSVGDRVIAAGVDYIREGMRVKPLVKERGL